VKYGNGQNNGLIVVVLLALWLIFSVVGVLTAIIKSVLLILIVVAICYALYHFFKKHQGDSRGPVGLTVLAAWPSG